MRTTVKYKAIIFDLDGVICHTDKYHYLAWKRIADELGIYFDENFNNQLRGISRMASLEKLLESYPKKLTEREKLILAEKKNHLYIELLGNMTSSDLSKDVLYTISEIKKRGIKIAIGSSSKNAKLILSRIGLDKTFDAISDGTNIIHSKPHPEVFLKAALMLDESPDLCLVVEDAKSGIQAAISANMDNAAIGNATKYNLATYDIKQISDLLSIV